jgi:hypothetical protein
MDEETVMETVSEDADIEEIFDEEV